MPAITTLTPRADSAQAIPLPIQDLGVVQLQHHAVRVAADALIPQPQQVHAAPGLLEEGPGVTIEPAERRGLGRHQHHRHPCQVRQPPGRLGLQHERHRVVPGYCLRQLFSRRNRRVEGQRRVRHPEVQLQRTHFRERRPERLHRDQRPHQVRPRVCGQEPGQARPPSASAGTPARSGPAAPPAAPARAPARSRYRLASAPARRETAGPPGPRRRGRPATGCACPPPGGCPAPRPEGRTAKPSGPCPWWAQGGPSRSVS